MRRRNLFIVAALCVTLALGGCRSNKLEDTGNAGTQGESTADAASEVTGCTDDHSKAVDRQYMVLRKRSGTGTGISL